MPSGPSWPVCDNAEGAAGRHGPPPLAYWRTYYLMTAYLMTVIRSATGGASGAAAEEWPVR